MPTLAAKRSRRDKAIGTWEGRNATARARAAIHKATPTKAAARALKTATEAAAAVQTAAVNAHAEYMEHLELQMMDALSGRKPTA